MRKLKLFFACMLLTLLSIGQVWGDTQAVLNSVSTKEVVSTAGQSVSKVFDGVTCQVTKTGGSTSPGFYTSSGIVRYYTNDVMTLSVESGNTISQIDFVMTSGSVGTASEGTLSSNTWTGNAESVSFTGGATVKISSITVTYSSGGSTKTLSSVAVSGTPTKTEYYAGQDFDPAGLTVTGTYSDNSTAPITSGITWSYNPSQELALNQTSIGVTATVSEITSAEYPVSLTVSEAPAAVNYEKVTEAPEGGWSGEYLIVYEPNASTARVWTGEEASNCYVEAEITAGIIAQPEGTASVTIAEMTGGYSIQVNGGTNDGKYIQNNGSSNGIKFVDAGVANTLAYENSAVTITCNSKKFRYNSTSGQDRFRYFGSDQQVIQLYKKVDGTAKPSAELAYADAQKLAKLGVAFTAPTLVNPHTVAVTYASSNTDVVEVNASTGAITAIKAVGVATITASYDGSGDYKEGSASYTICVTSQAGTEADPFDVIDVKNVIDAFGTLENAYATGIVSNVVTTELPSEGYITFYFSADGLTSGQQVEAYKCYGLNSAPFEAVTDVVTGATVVVTGNLKKFNSTYEFDQNCHVVSYVAPVAPKQSIANDQANPYTVAQALVYAADGVTYDLDDYVYVRGVVYDVKSFNNGAMNIFIKDADAENSFELFKCAGINDGSATTPFEALTDVQAGNIVIGYGQLTVFNTVSEFKQGNYLVDLDRPAVAVSSVSLPSTETVEVGSTVTLTATVSPDNATNKAITWSVQSGSDKASVADGVVTGVAEGEAVIRATSVADGTKYAECTVTVNAADPTKHVVTFDASLASDIAEDNAEGVTKSNINIKTSHTDGVNDQSTAIDYYQTFKNANLTVTCSVGNITKIEFTTTGGSSYASSGFAGVSDDKWTGNTNEVVLTASGHQVRMSKIIVTYKEDSRVEAGLAWSTDAVELTVGGAFTAPTLSNPNSIAAGEITIASNNTELATVTNGVVSLVENATGEATITATFEGNTSYKPATVSYTITVNEAGMDNVTFDSSVDHAESGKTTITKGGFTLSFTSGSMDGTQAEYRLYKSQTMTLSSTDYYIKKIEFTCTSGNPISGFADAEGLDKDNNMWTGEANSVSLVASGNQVRITKLKVYYIEDTRAASGLAWNPNEVEITLGDEFTAASLVNPNSIDASAITIESDKESLAVVNDGVVSLVENATGTAHITATFAGNETYKPASVSYTIKVNDPTPTIYVDNLNVSFGTLAPNASVDDQTITVTLTNVASVTATLGGTNANVFSLSKTAEIVSGDVITISFTGSTATPASFAATITISDGEDGAEDKTVNLSLTIDNVETPVSTSSKWIAATAADLVDGKQVLITGAKDGVTYAMGEDRINNRAAVEATMIAGVLKPGEGTMAFTLVDQSEGKFALRTSNGKFLYAASSNQNQLKTRDAITDDDAKWTLTATSVVANGNNTNETLRFNSGNNPKIFSCYADDTKQSPIALYVEAEVTSAEVSTADVEIDDDDIPVNADLTIVAGGKLTVNADKVVHSIILTKGENGDDPKKGGILAMENNTTLYTDELILQADGNSSGQMTGVTESNVVAGEIYFEKNFVTACRHWYNVAVPFPVNIKGGIQRADGQPLEWNTHFDFYQYNGSRRATEGADGGNWDKVAENGQLVPGVNYLCVFDQAYGTIRFKKAAGNLNNAGNIVVDDFGYATTSSADAGWNGIANNGLTYASASLEGVVLVQVLKSTGDGYETIILSNAVFVVGTPFFVQTSKDANVVFGAESGSQYYGAPQRTSGTSFELIAVELMQNNNVADRVFVNASEDAENQYVIGKDLAKFSVSTTTAQLWINNYNKKLCANDVQLVNNQAIYDLGLYAPAAGTYSISAQQVEGATLYVTYNGAIVWNLSLGDYELDLTRGTTTGYGLLLVAQPNQMPTGLDTTEGVAGDAVQKILLNGQLYILRDGHLFDAVGHEMK